MRSRKKLLWIAGALLLAGYLALAAHSMLDARRSAQAGLDRLEAARDELTPKDLLHGKGETALAAANKDFVAAHDAASSWWLQPLHYVPLVGSQIGSVESLAGGAVDITRIGSESLHDVRTAVDATDRPKAAERVALVRTLNRIAATTRSELQPIGLGPDRLLLPPLERAHAKVDENLSALRSTVTNLVDASAGIADFLQGPRRYLVIAANNSEMRVGSGAFLSLGELTVRDGRFDMGEMQPANLVQPKAGAVDPGRYDADFKARFGHMNPTNDFRELAQSARFDVLAPLAVDMWRSHGGHRVDGVLVLDPVALQGLLRATGPVTVDGFRYSADNLLDEVFVNQYRGLVADSNTTTQIERRDRLSRIARTAIQQLESGNWKTDELFEALRTAGVGRHILGWSSRTVEQKGWLGARVGGYFGPDAMMLTVQNRAGNKLDQFLTIDNVVTTSKNSNGNTDVVVTSKLVNAIPQPITQFPPYVIGPYLYNPNGEAGKYEGSFAVELPRLVRNNHLEIDGRKVVQSVAGRNGPDHRALATNVELKPGQTVTVTVRFSLPPGVKTLEVTPSARVLAPSLNRPATNWTFGGEVWNETKSHRITF